MQKECAMKSSILYPILICLLVFLFLYTGIAKMLDMDLFRHDMNNQVFPKKLVPVLVYFIPGIEIVTAALLCFDRTRFAGLLLSFVMMIAFTIYTALVLTRVFHRIPCSCGGVVRSLTWPQHLAFNLFFTATAFVAIMLFTREKQGMPKT